MAKQRFQYIIPEGVSVNGIISTLQASIACEHAPTRVVNRTYYDTFDWRLFSQQNTLEHELGDEASGLYLRSLATGDLCYSQKLEQVPKFVWDLPPTSLRKHLEPIVEMRALLPQVAVSSKIHALKVLDKRRKTVVRVILEDNGVVDHDKHKFIGLGKFIQVLPVRGYDSQAERVVKIIERTFKLESASDHLIIMALNVLGRKAGGYSSKLNLHLDPQMRADEATKIVLHRLLDTMLANEAGTREDIDTEFLHDFRVSVRRTRSAISQFKGMIPQKILDRFRPEFTWLGQITGPTRDMDVYLLKFDDYRSRLPASVQHDLEPLRSFLQAHQSIEQRTLAKALNSSRYRKLINGWRTYLNTPVPARSMLPNAIRPIGQVASERIWRVYRRALKKGHAITPESPAEVLHELRKTCKKLRYLMEFFQSLYRAQDIKALIKVLKVLQDNLGDFQDFEVQVAKLKEFSHQMMQQAQAPAETFMAMGILVENLAQRQHQTRAEFAARFQQFARHENQQRFKVLFAFKQPEAMAS
jgi:CHAD domain-containing protein